MFGLVDSLAKRVVRKGLRRGLAEGSASWIALGAVAWLVRFLMRPDTPKVAHEQIRVGETIIVRHLPPPPSRRDNRKLARARALTAAAGSDAPTE